MLAYMSYGYEEEVCKFVSSSAHCHLGECYSRGGCRRERSREGLDRGVEETAGEISRVAGEIRWVMTLICGSMERLL
jgi:hypothetical protein